MDGEYEVEELKKSVNHQPDGEDTTSSSLSGYSAQNVLPSEFLDIHMTNKQDGLSGFYQSPPIGSWKATLDPKTITENLAEESIEFGFIPRPDCDQYLFSGEDEDESEDERVLSYLS